MYLCKIYWRYQHWFWCNSTSVIYVDQPHFNAQLKSAEVELFYNWDKVFGWYDRWVRTTCILRIFWGPHVVFIGLGIHKSSGFSEFSGGLQLGLDFGEYRTPNLAAYPKYWTNTTWLGFHNKIPWVTLSMGYKWITLSKENSAIVYNKYYITLFKVNFI